MRVDFIVHLTFTRYSVAAPWEATVMLRRETVLAVKYNVLMLQSDFEDGDYLTEPQFGAELSQNGQFPGTGASIRPAAPAAKYCVDTNSTGTVPSFRAMWTSPLVSRTTVPAG